jgi:Plasmid pRiA4b ORF-3-like protein
MSSRIFNLENEHRTKLAQVLAKPKAQMTYLYDFGDSWEHRIELEQVLPLEEGKTYPVCIAGKRNCPPEDCGGPWGYQNMLEILSNPEHEEYEDTLTWLGSQFDAEHFDLKRMNDRLRSL